MPKDNSSFFPKRKRRAASGRVHVSVLALILFGSLSSPGDGIVRITLLTPGEEGKKGKINFRPGIEPGTQRLGVQYTMHQAITQDKSSSPHSFLCTTSGRWRICQPHMVPVDP